MSTPRQGELERARSAAALAASDVKRAGTLVKAQAISREEYDSRTSAVDQGDATVRAAETQPLDQPEREEDEGRGEPDGRVRWHKSNEGRGDAHPGERHDEGVLPADLVAEPAEDERSQRPDQEAAGVNRGGVQQLGGRIVVRKEQRREINRARGIRVPVVPLDQVADRAAEDGAQALAWSVGLLVVSSMIFERRDLS